MSSGFSGGNVGLNPPVTPVTLTGISVNISIGTPTTIYTVATGRKLYITQIQASTGSASTLTLFVGAVATIAMGVPANGSAAVSDYPLLVLNSGELLKVATSGVTMNYIITGFLL